MGFNNKSSRIVEEGESLEVVGNVINEETVKQKECIIKVAYAGVCHTDIHLWRNYYDMGEEGKVKFTSRGVKFPMTPGHEIGGEITYIPENSTATTLQQQLQVGDKVVVYPWLGCGSCIHCDVELQNQCVGSSSNELGIFQDGGYTQYIVVPQKYCVKLPENVSLRTAAILPCSGLTSFSSLLVARNHLDKLIAHAALTTQPAESEATTYYVCIIGCGGLGLLGLQLALAMFHEGSKYKVKVVCVDVTESKLETAKKMGAHHTFNSASSDVEDLIEVCGEFGPQIVIDYVNSQSTAKMALRILRRGGKWIPVGLFGGSITLPLPTIPLKAISMEGVAMGNFKDFETLIQFISESLKKGLLPHLDTAVQREYKLHEATTALLDLEQGRITGRAVITPHE